MPSRIPSCRNSGPRRLIPVAVALLALAAPALAQVGPPVRLLPPPPGTAAPVPGQPAAATPAAAPAAATDSAIRATPLAPVDASWVGTLGDGARPLPQTMWQGTARPLLDTMLPQLGPTLSPAWQDLARRLLLSNALAPPGQEPPDQPSLAALRVGRLLALGEIDGALAVIEALPAAMRSEELERDRVDLHFAKNNIDGACRLVQEGVARYQGAWWARALIACQALTGHPSEAALGMGVLREEKAPPDSTFDMLVEAVGGHHPGQIKLRAPTPILVTLLAAAKLPLPAEALDAADAMTLRAWVGNEAVPPLQRLAAAERAAALGAIAPESLADLYGKIEFRPDELGAAIKQGKAPATPRDDALLYQVARTDPAAGVRAASLARLLEAAQKRGTFVVTARVLASILVELPPSQDLSSFAPVVVRALYAAGRPEAATPWLSYADPAAAPLLLPLTRLAVGAGAGSNDQTMRDAVAGIGRADARRASLLLSLLAALGTPVPDADLAPLIAGPQETTVPNAAVWLDLQQAAAAKRVGETVLAALISLRTANDRLSIEPTVVSGAVAALAAVGLEGDARALALEVALDAGV